MLNDSFEDSFFQIKFFVMLNCSDWSHLHLIWPVKPDKAVFVNSVTGKPVFYPPRESELAFSFRPTRKDQQVCGSMLMFHVVNTKMLGIRLKIFNYTRCTFRFNTFAGCFHSLRAVTHCMKYHFQKYIIEALYKGLYCFIFG